MASELLQQLINLGLAPAAPAKSTTTSTSTSTSKPSSRKPSSKSSTLLNLGQEYDDNEAEDGVADARDDVASDDADAGAGGGDDDDDDIYQGLQADMETASTSTMSTAADIAKLYRKLEQSLSSSEVMRLHGHCSRIIADLALPRDWLYRYNEANSKRWPARLLQPPQQRLYSLVPNPREVGVLAYGVISVAGGRHSAKPQVDDPATPLLPPFEWCTDNWALERDRVVFEGQTGRFKPKRRRLEQGGSPVGYNKALIQPVEQVLLQETRVLLNSVLNRIQRARLESATSKPEADVETESDVELEALGQLEEMSDSSDDHDGDDVEQQESLSDDASETVAPAGLNHGRLRASNRSDARDAEVQQLPSSVTSVEALAVRSRANGEIDVGQCIALARPNDEEPDECQDDALIATMASELRAMIARIAAKALTIRESVPKQNRGSTRREIDWSLVCSLAVELGYPPEYVARSLTWRA